jgi:hypothetical protein
MHYNKVAWYSCLKVLALLSFYGGNIIMIILKILAWIFWLSFQELNFWFFCHVMVQRLFKAFSSLHGLGIQSLWQSCCHDLPSQVKICSKPDTDPILWAHRIKLKLETLSSKRQRHTRRWYLEEASAHIHPCCTIIVWSILLPSWTLKFRDTGSEPRLRLTGSLQ